MTLTWHGDAVERLVRERAQDAAREAAEHVLAASNRIIPTDPGRELERSGKVTSQGTTSAVSYSTDYAVIQHERMNYAHDPGRSAKFLEVTLTTSRPAVVSLIHRRLRW